MKVVIVGGTHGNEKTGVFLLRRWRAHPSRLPADHEYLLIEGNTEAIRKNSRYVDFDFNRSFNGGNPDPSTYEHARARELQDTLLKWADGEPFFLIDLHTTTANMRGTIVISKTDRLSAAVARDVIEAAPEARLLINSLLDEKNIFVESLAPHSLLVEVGPVAQNVLEASAVALTETLVTGILRSLSDWCARDLPSVITLEGIQESGSVDYPRDDGGAPTALIHRALQGRDFQPLHPGDPMFETLEGGTIPYGGAETIYPIFINEAAYYEKKIAFRIGKKTVLQVGDDLNDAVPSRF